MVNNNLCIDIYKICVILHIEHKYLETRTERGVLYEFNKVHAKIHRGCTAL